MAVELSIEAEAFLQQNNITGNIILELDGFPSLYGSVKVTKIAKIGEFVIGDGTLIGGAVTDDTSKDYISLTGTTNNIQQKLDQDRGGSSSITSFKLRLIDKGDELTQAFAPGVTVDDILGNEAVVYWQPVGSKHPTDSARLFVGIVSSASFGAGFVDLVVQHPSTLARVELFPKVTSELASSITDSQTSFDVTTSLANLIDPGDSLKTYLRIDDELIEVRALSGTTTVIVENRGALGTTAASHDAVEVESFYLLEGDPVDLSLKLLLSNPDQQEFAEKTASRIVQVDAVTNVPNAVFFDGINVEDELGLVVGDQLAIISGADASNLTGFVSIVSFGTNSSGSWVVLEDLVSLIPEVDIAAVCRFKSKYNVMTTGAGKNIKPYHVDVAQFESLLTTFGAQFFNYSYPIKDSITLKEFMEEKLMYPSGLFSLPRQGRISMGIAAPPILGPNAKTLNADNITNATRVTISRSINEAFYNSIAFKFNEDYLDDRFLSGTIFSSEDSFNRVNIGTRTLTIEAGGIAESTENRNKIDSIARRFLDRYQFGAEQITCDVNFKTAFSVEPGDTIIVEGDTIGLSDITQGSRDFSPRIMEVTNLSINLKSGACRVQLSDTNLSTRARYGVFSPASIIGTGSTASELVITRSYGTEDTELERDKWSDYLVQKVRVRNDDYTFDETTTLIALSSSNPNILEVNPPLSTAPSAGYIIESPVYDESSTNAMRFWKALHCYFTPQVAATGGTTTTITVSSGDASKFLEGAPVRIHLEDYSEDDTTTVAQVSGTTITLNKTLGFTVTSSHLVDLIGFGDGGSPYAWY